VRLKKRVLVATVLGNVLLIDLVDSFVGAPRLRRLMVLLRSAHRVCCLVSKSISSATTGDAAAREAEASKAKLRAATSAHSTSNRDQRRPSGHILKTIQFSNQIDWPSGILVIYWTRT
jgi:hypothetical protein